ncbi:MAG: hypothetical protein Q8L29_02110 [archaeon]|nr:hypothetical protein [archaeon]
MNLLSRLKDYVKYRKSKNIVRKFESMPDDIKVCVPYEIVEAYLIIGSYKNKYPNRNNEREAIGAIEEFTSHR